eukprot:1793613-Pleurochrysis_carterae.AAC.3
MLLKTAPIRQEATSDTCTQDVAGAHLLLENDLRSVQAQLVDLKVVGNHLQDPPHPGPTCIHVLVYAHILLVKLRHRTPCGHCDELHQSCDTIEAGLYHDAQTRCPTVE